jgi:hypothetical protein
MAKKHWIYVKRGLSEDPKHREAMGMSVWCYMHILDRADWETGIVHGWKDEDEAADMSVSPHTLRDWRQKLEAEGYIRCRQIQHGLEITILRWVNPRDYSSKVLNTATGGGYSESQGDAEPSPSAQGDTQGDTHGDTEGDTQADHSDVTPTSDSESKRIIDQGMDPEKEKLLGYFRQAAIGIWPRDPGPWRKMERNLTAPAVSISRENGAITVTGLGQQAALFQDHYARAFERSLVGVLGGEEVRVEFKE